MPKKLFKAGFCRPISSEEFELRLYNAPYRPPRQEDKNGDQNTVWGTETFALTVHKGNGQIRRIAEEDVG